jgi:fucose permease
MNFDAMNVLVAVLYGFLMLSISSVSFANAKRYDDRGARTAGFLSAAVAMLVFAGAVYMALHLGHP